MSSTAGVEITFLIDELAFESEAKCREFLLAAGAKLDPTSHRIDSKLSLPGLRASPLLTKKII